MFPKQRALAEDKAKKKAALCTRRAGKSWSDAAMLFDAADRFPGSVCPYISLTRKSAKNIMWPVMRDFVKLHQIDAQPMESTLTYRLSNGSEIPLIGADTEKFIERLLGGKYPRVVVDECFHPDTKIETSVGKKRIADIAVGDTVKNAIGYGKVLKISKKNVHNIVNLEYSGRKIVCSANHQFFTSRGWKPASDLKKGDLLGTHEFCLWLLRQSFSEVNEVRKAQLQVLQSDLLREIRADHSEVYRQVHKQKCDGIFGIKKENDSHTQKEWPPSRSKGREWAPTNRAGKADYESDSGTKVESCNCARWSISWVSNLLQGGPSNCEQENCDRSGREQPRPDCSKDSGQKEGRQAPFIRLDHVEIQKQAGNERDSNCYFYDLTVDGHPSFVVNGALVHNCQAFGMHLQDLIERVLEPCTLDYRGDIVLTGTPGPVTAGYFYEITAQGKHGFSVHNWSVLDNVYLPHAKSFIEQLRTDRGWTNENPTYRREWLGQWVSDPDALIYRYTEANDYDKLPEGEEWMRTMAVDYGFNDQTAFSVIAYNPHSPVGYIEHCEGHSGLIPSQIAGRLYQLIDKYKPYKIAADTGALGKMITEEMVRRYSIPMEPVKKQDKMGWISLMNGAFVDNTLKVQRNLVELKNQYKTLVKDDKGREDQSLRNDLCDSVLYAWRHTFAYLFEPRVNLTSEQRFKREEDKYLTELEARLKAEKEGQISDY